MLLIGGCWILLGLLLFEEHVQDLELSSDLWDMAWQGMAIRIAAWPRLWHGPQRHLIVLALADKGYFVFVFSKCASLSSFCMCAFGGNVWLALGRSLTREHSPYMDCAFFVSPRLSIFLQE